MNHLWTILPLLLFKLPVLAQQLPVVKVNKDVSTHFILSEPISFADISTEKVAGDLPKDNIFRIKPKKKGSEQDPFQGIVTIVAEKYMVQYEMHYTSAKDAHKLVTLTSSQGTALKDNEVTLSTSEMKAFCLQILDRKRSYHAVKSYDNQITARLNNIYTRGDYFFMDVTFKNHSNIKYDIDQMRYKIEDKKVGRYTNAQDVELQTVFKLYDTPEFKRTHRNVLVFRKFTFPNDKVFTIEMAEEQISGRRIVLEIDFNDILYADTI
jgi:conjugative transposon TraN protein